MILNTRGQMLLIALLLLVVIIISIPALVNVSTRVRQASTDEVVGYKVREAAEAAFAQVNYQLASDPALWDKAMEGQPLTDAGLDGSRTFTGTGGVSYTITCARSPELLPNQLKVSLQLTAGAKVAQRARTFEALFSRKTMGVQLPTMPHTPAALYLLNDLDLVGRSARPAELAVHWGPIVSFSRIRLTEEADSLTYGHYPRKFLRSVYQARYPLSGDSDKKEYWSNAAIGTPAEVDLERYKTAAKQTTGISSPGRSGGTGYIEARERPIVFRSMSAPSAPDSAPVLFIDGSAQFQSDGMDMAEGAVVVTGHAIFTEPSTGKVLTLRVPAQASLEYPYLPDQGTFPCQAQLGGSCSSTDAIGGTGLVDFRGFLYVRGDLIIRKNTVIVGVVRVDGRLRIDGGKRLTIFFDDRVAHTVMLKDTTLERQILHAPIR